MKPNTANKRRNSKPCCPQGKHSSLLGVTPSSPPALPSDATREGARGTNRFQRELRMLP